MIENVRISKEVIAQELEGEAILLNMQDGKFFGLNPVAKRMWDLLNELGQSEKVLKQLLEEYDTNEQQLRQGLDNFIDQLLTRGLIEAE